MYNSNRYYVINTLFPIRFLNPQKLLMTSPQIQKFSNRHQPESILKHMQLDGSVIVHPGKDLSVGYPAVVFFVPSPSDWSALTTVRAVPLNIASVMASL